MKLESHLFLLYNPSFDHFICDTNHLWWPRYLPSPYFHLILPNWLCSHCLCADDKRNISGCSLLVFPTAFCPPLLVKTLGLHSPTVAPCAVCCVVQIALQLEKFLLSHYAINFNHSSHHLFSSAGTQPSRRLIKPSRLAPKPSSSCLRLSEAHPGYVSFEMLLGKSSGSCRGRNDEKRKRWWVLESCWAPCLVITSFPVTP